MFKRFLATAALAALVPLGAQAAVQTISLNLTVVSDNTGNFLGDTGTGTITYNDTALVLDTGTFFGDPVSLGLPFFPDFDFNFTIFGQTFTDANDSDSSFLVSSAVPTDVNISISETDLFNPTIFTDPQLNGFSIISTGSNLTQTSPGVFSAEVIVDDDPLNAIPLPASVLFLGGALGGLGFVARRRKPA